MLAFTEIDVIIDSNLLVFSTAGKDRLDGQDVKLTWKKSRSLITAQLANQPWSGHFQAFVVGQQTATPKNCNTKCRFENVNERAVSGKPSRRLPLLGWVIVKIIFYEIKNNYFSAQVLALKSLYSIT